MNASPAVYWQSSDRAITVYNERYEDVIAAGRVPVADVELIHDDPPYGQREATKRGERRRGTGGRSSTLHGGRIVRAKDDRTVRAAINFEPVTGDEQPFDPSPLLALDRRLVVWGGHRCVPALPPSPSWLFWGKREDTGPDDNGDGELAWTNLGGPIREWQHLWRGTCRASETGVVHLAPTQKPVELSLFVFRRAKLKRGDLVFVPHGGSGPDLSACRTLGLRLIWCDVESTCCDTAIARLPDAPVEIVARALAHQRRVRSSCAAALAVPVGPLFGSSQ